MNERSATPASPGIRSRDPRLDFFRGVGMFIIFMAHTPGNWFTLYIPARFGWSDATEIFVFCSGMASAIAFGKIFSDIGWFMGAARIVYRMWQVYWSHIGLFFVILLLMIVQTRLAATGDLCLFEGSRLCPNPDGTASWDYVGRLNIIHLLQNSSDVNNAAGNLLGLMTLTWVPNLFDILPMYIVILGMIPVVMALRKINVGAVFAFVAIIWLGAQSGLLWLPAEPWSDREWFFNPFGWQLVFFTGFAFMSGWLPKPPINKTLVIVSAAFVLLTIPFAFWGIHRNEDFAFGFDAFQLENGRWIRTWFGDVRESIALLRAKTDFGLFRYIHFLALAYLFWILAGEHGKNLNFKGRLGQIFVKVVHKVGQQSLATFMSGLVFGRFVGFMFDIFGKTWMTMFAFNLAGMAAMVAVAYLVGWIKKTPWKTTSTMSVPASDNVATEDNRDTVQQRPVVP